MKLERLSERDPERLAVLYILVRPIRTPLQDAPLPNMSSEEGVGCNRTSKNLSIPSRAYQAVQISRSNDPALDASTITRLLDLDLTKSLTFANYTPVREVRSFNASVSTGVIVSLPEP